MKRLKFKGLSGSTPDELAEHLERFVEEETTANYGSFQLIDVKYQKGYRTDHHAIIIYEV